MARKLKVYRTPIGFHDAYVAAPSMKAALEAWGSDANLFARGVAEIVTDAALGEEPLRHPGEVIRRMREAPEEAGAGRSKRVSKARPSPRHKPRPSRARVEAASAALNDADKRHARELAAVRERERALAEERRAIERRHDSERRKLQAAVERAETSYRRALDTWRD